MPRALPLSLLLAGLLGACIDDRRIGTDEDEASDGGGPDARDGLDGFTVAPPSDGGPAEPDAAEPDAAPTCEVADRTFQIEGEVRVPIAGVGRDIDVRGDRAWLTHDRGVEVIDLSNPAAPAHLSGVAAPGAHGLALTPDGFGVLAALGDGVRMLDLRDDRDPREVGAFDLVGAAGAEYAHDLVLVGDRAYVAAGSQGLWTIDVSDRRSPRPIGSCCGGDRPHPLAGPRDVEVRGDIAWLVDSEDGLAAVDIQDPTRPTVVGRAELPAEARTIRLDADQAYILVEGDQLVVANLASPTAPSTSDPYDLPPMTTALAFHGDTLFVASSSVFAIDRRQLATTVRSLDLGRGAVKAMEAAGDTLYIVVPQALVIVTYRCR